jgi:uncharacterized protein
MKESLINKLILISKNRQVKNDPSHDFQHVQRVLNLAVEIGKKVEADLDIVIPAALFHDTVVYRKDSPKSKYETDESAEVAGHILKKIREYPKEKIEKVKICIRQCSFSKGIIPDILESKVLQDADMLESTGAISIMRTFSSGGQMNRPFYDLNDPFCKKGLFGVHSGLWLFYKRLLLVEKRMHTKFAKKIAKRRTNFLITFLDEFKKELIETEIIYEKRRSR